MRLYSTFFYLELNDHVRQLLGLQPFGAHLLRPTLMSESGLIFLGLLVSCILEPQSKSVEVKKVIKALVLLCKITCALLERKSVCNLKEYDERWPWLIRAL